MIYKKALDRVTKAGYNKNNIFDMLLQDAEMQEEPTMHYCLGFLEPEDELEIGDYVPEVWLILRKVTQE